MTSSELDLPNPLLEAQHDSLSELMSRDPLQLQRQDRDTIVAELRRMREKWLTDEAAGKIKPAKAVKTKDAKPVLELKDLDL